MKFVGGFAFSRDFNSVVLVRKNRQRFGWMDGLLNGVGGEIVPGEAPIEAMMREFRQEADVATEPEDWHHFATMYSSSGDRIEWFWLANTNIFDLAHTVTDELIEKHDVATLYKETTVAGVMWLMYMALELRERPDVVHRVIKGSL